MPTSRWMRLELDLHLLAQLEVEGAERLVEQQHPGPVHQGPGQGDPLPLAAGQLPRPPAAEPLEPDRGQRLLRPGPALGPGDALDHQPVADVLQHGHVREQRVVLEDRVDVPVERRVPGDVPAAEVHPARRRRLEAGDHPQHRGLARPGRPEHGEELAVAGPRGRSSRPPRRPRRRHRRGRRRPCAARRGAPQPRSPPPPLGDPPTRATVAPLDRHGNGFRCVGPFVPPKPWPIRDRPEAFRIARDPVRRGSLATVGHRGTHRG